MTVLTKNIQLSEKIEFLNQIGRLETERGINNFYPKDEFTHFIGHCWSDMRLLNFINEIIKKYGLYPYLQTFILTPELFKQKLQLLTIKQTANGKEDSKRDTCSDASKDY